MSSNEDLPYESYHKLVTTRREIFDQLDSSQTTSFIYHRAAEHRRKDTTTLKVREELKLNKTICFTILANNYPSLDITPDVVDRCLRIFTLIIKHATHLSYLVLYCDKHYSPGVFGIPRRLILSLLHRKGIYIRCSDKEPFTEFFPLDLIENDDAYQVFLDYWGSRPSYDDNIEDSVLWGSEEAKQQLREIGITSMDEHIRLAKDKINQIYEEIEKCEDEMKKSENNTEYHECVRRLKKLRNRKVHIVNHIRDLERERGYIDKCNYARYS